MHFFKSVDFLENGASQALEISPRSHLFGTKSHIMGENKRGPLCHCCCLSGSHFQHDWIFSLHSRVQVNTLDQSNLPKCCNGSRWAQNSAGWFPAFRPRLDAGGDEGGGLGVFMIKHKSERLEGAPGATASTIALQPARISQGATSSGPQETLRPRARGRAHGWAQIKPLQMMDVVGIHPGFSDVG